jgi:TRAP-type C4-dicarboxylate transport system substrate-binding protein
MVTPGDAKGLKIRCPPTPIYVDEWKQLGAIPTPLSSTEIYLGLSRGTIDAADTSAGYSVANKFDEVGKFYTNTAHSIGMAIFIFNLSRFQSLPTSVQDVLKSSAADAGAAMTKAAIQQDDDAFATMTSHGLKVTPRVDTSAWRSAIQPVFDKYAAQLPPDLVASVQLATR